jgi:very-short-patch-repair endonuclease
MRSPVLTLKRARRLRREMTKPEVILWSVLRDDALGGLRFRRQHPVGPYILDFYCAALQLCIDIDGQTHNTPEAERHDEARTAWLAAKGVRVIRFAAADILDPDRLNDAVLAIEALAAPSISSAAPSPP